MNLTELETKTNEELAALAKEMGIENGNQRRDELAEMAERRRTKTLHRAIRTPNPRPKQSRT